MYILNLYMNREHAIISFFKFEIDGNIFWNCFKLGRQNYTLGSQTGRHLGKKLLK